LVATVEPWANSRRSESGRPCTSRSRRTASITPIDWSSGVLATLSTRIEPLRSSWTTTSVNVPPTSIPSRRPVGALT
jgi:hypothetical protein